MAVHIAEVPVIDGELHVFREAVGVNVAHLAANARSHSIDGTDDRARRSQATGYIFNVEGARRLAAALTDGVDVSVHAQMGGVLHVAHRDGAVLIATNRAMRNGWLLDIEGANQLAGALLTAADTSPWPEHAAA